MMADIFSSFDSSMYNSLFPSNTMFMMLNTMLLMLIQMSFWLSNTRIKMLSHYLKSTIYTQLSHTSSINLKGMTSFISSMFIMLIIINLMGMIPYTYSTSSQLIFTMSLSFPIWLSFMLSSTFYKPKKTIAYMLPDSAPMWLNPFLVIIESTSLLVRPLTLSFRLAANMSAGHIVMSLTGIYLSSAWFNNMMGTLMLLLTTTSYILFELTICVIQAYIFCLLLSLYSDDHMN